MNSSIELHDSECLKIEVENDGRGFVLLDASIHRSEERPGWEAGECGIQRVRMNFENMTVDGVVGNLPASIYEGSLTTAHTVTDNMLELPGRYPGEASLKVMLSEDARVVIVSGTNVTLVPESEFRFVERFNPDSSQTCSDLP